MFLAIIACLIVLTGLVVGYQDLARFRFRRVRAIAGVCFAESIRRRILWITPLAIVGVIAVSQFTRPADEQDYIRQTAKYCLFASGLIVIVAAVILACTNLPREIESRVIFTVVTKPTTRLEIVLGKILGFVSVSGMILLIMGLFSYGYLELRAASLVREIRQTLASGKVDPAAEPTLRHYADTGLLATKALEWPVELEVYSREPDAAGTRWMGGARQQYFTVPFSLNADERRQLADLASQGNGVFLITTLRLRHHKPSHAEEQDLQQGNYPMEGAAAAAANESLHAGPFLPTTTAATLPAVDAKPVAQLTFSLFDKNGQPVASEDVNPQRPVPAPPVAPGGSYEDPRPYVVPLSGKSVEQIVNTPDFRAEVSAVTPTIEYGAGPKPIGLFVINKDNPRQVLLRVDPREHAEPDGAAYAQGGRAGKPGAPAEPKFYARVGRSGMQIRGQAPEEGEASVAVYAFRGTDTQADAEGQVGFQIKLSLERGGDLDAERHQTSRVSVRVRNAKTGAESPVVVVEPETSRILYAYFPADSVAGGDFDIMLRGVTPGQWLGLHGLTATLPSVTLITATKSFTANLAKSLFILWLLSALVVTIAVFCSTFLSWPIAVVLTIVILFGRWGVDQLGDALAPGNSRNTQADIFGLRDPAKAKAVTESLEGLSTMLRYFGKILPDVETFPVIEDIDRGVSIPAVKVWGALGTLGWYGLPLVMLTYLILRNKEVAP